MSNEDLQKKYDLLVEKVRRMRGYQREYWKYRVKSDLQTAKRFEKEVDQLIDKEVQEQGKKQKDLF